MHSNVELMVALDETVISSSSSSSCDSERLDAGILGQTECNLIGKRSDSVQVKLIILGSLEVQAFGYILQRVLNCLED